MNSPQSYGYLKPGSRWALPRTMALIFPGKWAQNAKYMHGGRLATALSPPGGWAQIEPVLAIAIGELALLVPLGGGPGSVVVFSKIERLFALQPTGLATHVDDRLAPLRLLRGRP